MDQKQLLSVGIDVGTSTSQLIFSRLKMENQAGFFAVPSISIVDKEIIYQSPVYTTPLVNSYLIDADALRKIIEHEYRTAGVRPEEVETGAVIITGESARKENSEAVTEQLSRFAGDFVVSTAGPDLESVIAGQGSGACHFSEDNGTVVANLDIGGGTTNVAIFDNGEVCGRGCLDIGGRQVIVDREKKISYISPSAQEIAKQYGIAIRVGQPAEISSLKQLCRGMAELLEQFLGLAPPTEALGKIQTSGASDLILPERPIRGVCFSGGVADCIRNEERDPFVYGDIGVLLGEAIRSSRLCREFRLVNAEQTIRATVIGAGSYTTTISGSTIAYAMGLFPMKNVPVLKLDDREEAECWRGEGYPLSRKIRWFLEQNDAERMVLAINGQRDPDYENLKTLAGTLAEVADWELPEGAPLILISREDIGKALGQLLRQQLGSRRRVISLDAIRVEQNNYVDFGRPIMNGLVVPVVVKTLIFG